MYIDNIKTNLLKLLKNNNHPNICLYGINTGYNLLIECLNKIYKINKNSINNYKDISYIKNNIYYEFNLKNIKYKNKETWINLLKDICLSDNYYYINQKKIIILNNYHYLNGSIQNILKVIIEKNTHVVFIILTLNISKIIAPIKSRLLCVRIPKINNYDKWKLIKKKINLNINNFKNYNCYDTNDILFLHNNKIEIKDNILKNIIEYINLNIIINYEKKKTIDNIKKISYYILTIGIPIIYFYKELLIYLLNDYKLTFNKKYKIVKIISDSEYKYNKSYYKMIHIENLLIKLVNIIKI